MPKRYLLGFGVFYSPHWKMRDWKFGDNAGIHPTREAASEAFNSLTSHCLYRETRRIYTTTMLNVGSYNDPEFVQASYWARKNKDKVHDRENCLRHREGAQAERSQAVSENLKIGKACPVLANSRPEILQPMKGCDGTFQVVWFEELDAHGLLYQRDGSEEEAYLLATHNNGHAVHCLAERLIEGDRARVLDQLDYLQCCGGTAIGEKFLPLKPTQDAQT